MKPEKNLFYRIRFNQVKLDLVLKREFTFSDPNSVFWGNSISLRESSSPKPENKLHVHLVICSFRTNFKHLSQNLRLTWGRIIFYDIKGFSTRNLRAVHAIVIDAYSRRKIFEQIFLGHWWWRKLKWSFKKHIFIRGLPQCWSLSRWGLMGTLNF